jgi:hypothetical protein
VTHSAPDRQLNASASPILAFAISASDSNSLRVPPYASPTQSPDLFSASLSGCAFDKYCARQKRADGVLKATTEVTRRARRHSKTTATRQAYRHQMSQVLIVSSRPESNRQKPRASN